MHLSFNDPIAMLTAHSLASNHCGDIICTEMLIWCFWKESPVPVFTFSDLCLPFINKLLFIPHNFIKSTDVRADAFLNYFYCQDELRSC